MIDWQYEISFLLLILLVRFYFGSLIFYLMRLCFFRMLQLIVSVISLYLVFWSSYYLFLSSWRTRGTGYFDYWCDGITRQSASSLPSPEVIFWPYLSLTKISYIRSFICVATFLYFLWSSFSLSKFCFFVIFLFIQSQGCHKRRSMILQSVFVVKKTNGKVCRSSIIVYFDQK